MKSVISCRIGGGVVCLHGDRSKVTTIEDGERKEGLGPALFNKSECSG